MCNVIRAPSTHIDLFQKISVYNKSLTFTTSSYQSECEINCWWIEVLEEEGEEEEEVEEK